MRLWRAQRLCVVEVGATEAVDERIGNASARLMRWPSPDWALRLVLRDERKGLNERSGGLLVKPTYQQARLGDVQTTP